MDSVEVNLNQGLVAGRDIIFGDSTEFFEPRLDDVRSPHYLIVEGTLDLVERLSRQRLLILGGYHLLDRETFALHLAWLLKTRIETNSEVRIEVRQWSREVDRGRLLSFFQSYKTPTIFLLPEANPSQFGFDVRQLHEDLARTAHFAILSSISDREQWSIELRAAHDCWFDESTSSLFPSEQMLAFCSDQLQSVDPEPPDALDDRSLCGIDLREVVARLKTPNRIFRFVRSIDSISGSLETGVVERELDRLADGKEAVQRWYRRLDRRHQLLTLGLILFDGLYEDQAFAALEKVMNFVWKSWEPQLGQFDLDDLELLRAHFPDAGLQRLISSRSEAVRQEVLEVAWSLHRRHVMAVLPVTIDLLKQAVGATLRESGGISRTSALQKDLTTAQKEEQGNEPPDLSSPGPMQQPSDNLEDGSNDAFETPNASGAERLAWDLEGPSLELWGSEARSAMLRDSIADVLSRLARLSADGLDSHLRALASDPAPAVRIVAAEALAGWHRSNSNPASSLALLDKLHEWNQRALDHNSASWLRDLSNRQRRQQLVSIRTTVAMTVGYAARNDPQDRMCAGLTKLFEEFLEEQNGVVQKTFSEITVPLVMGAHLVQLAPVLYESARRRKWLRRGLALGFMLALELRPDRTLAIMDSWHARSQTASPDLDMNMQQRARESVLAALIESYSLFSSFSNFDLFGVEVVFSKFQRILAEEKGRYLRRLTLWGALLQFQRNLSQVDPLLQVLVCEATLDERADLVQGIGFIFWRQRQTLDGGDRSVIHNFGTGAKWNSSETQPLAWDEIVVRGSSEFSVWSHSLRPRTQLEEVLRRWIQDEDYPVAQQLAFEALVDLHAKEEWLIEVAKRRVVQDHSATRPPEIWSLERSYEVSWTGRFLTYLAVSESSGLRNKILALLPQLLQQYRTLQKRSSTMSFLEAWKQDVDLQLARLMRYLDFTALLYRSRYLAIGLLIIALVGYYWLMQAE